MIVVRLVSVLLCAGAARAAGYCPAFGGRCYPTTEFCDQTIGADSSELCGEPNMQCCLSAPRQGGTMCEKMFDGECIDESRRYDCAMTGIGWDGAAVCPGNQECCIEFRDGGSFQTPEPPVDPEPVEPDGPTEPETDDDDCGAPEVPLSEGWRIVGGEPSQHGSWPWQISLRFYGSHICGGSIINRHWILTAAHCFGQVTNPSQVTVVTGDNQQDRNHGTEREHRVTQIIKHRGYSGSRPSSPHDIALMRLAQPIAYNKYTKKVCLNQQRGRFDYKNECWLTGWGRTQGTGNARHLQQIRGYPISNNHCSQLWYGGIEPGHICFGEGGRGACMGDSGGPWVCRAEGKFYQVGVSSFGSATCVDRGSPSVYTRVSSYIDWIEQNTST